MLCTMGHLFSFSPSHGDLAIPRWLIGQTRFYGWLVLLSQHDNQGRPVDGRLAVFFTCLAASIRHLI